MSTVPTMPKQPMVFRGFRVPEPRSEDAKAKADERGENVSDVLRDALERYVRRK